MSFDLPLPLGRVVSIMFVRPEDVQTDDKVVTDPKAVENTKEYYVKLPKMIAAMQRDLDLYSPTAERTVLICRPIGPVKFPNTEGG